MKKQIWTESYKITSFLINLRQRAGLYAVLNFIQDVGWQHAFHLGIKLKQNHSWVFTRQKLTMQKWPAWSEVLTINTWIRVPTAGNFFLRDYELFIGDEKVGQCTSAFAIFDMQSRKITTENLSSFSSIWRNDINLSEKPEKIIVKSEMENLSQFQVRNSDIDSNNHVNNTKYAQWILDSLPIEMLKAGRNLMEYDINFLAETKIGDTVIVQRAKDDKILRDFSVAQFQGIRALDQKVAFTAELKFNIEN